MNHIAEPGESIGNLASQNTAVTRLLCARVYLFGLVASLGTLNRLLGPPFSARDLGVGYDREVILFHSLQSALLSVAFLVVGLLLYYLPLDPESFASPLTIALVVAKVGVVNPWIARTRFRAIRTSLHFSIPMLGPMASALTRLLHRRKDFAGANTVYFKGPRPFVGFGSEINAWTVVVDTQRRVDHLGNPVHGEPAPEAVGKVPTPSDMYRAIRAKLKDLELSHLHTSCGMFVDGERSDETPLGQPFQRPPPILSEADIVAMDADGSKARRYLMIHARNPARDLWVAQFVRFQLDGQLLLGEFASLVLPPAKRRYYALDRVLEVSVPAFLIWGVLLVLIAGVLSTIVAPFTDGVLHWKVPWVFAEGYIQDGIWWLAPYVWHQITSGWFVYRIIDVSVLLVLLFVLWRLLTYLYDLVGIALGLRRQCGLSRTYREFIAAGGSLDYFDMQTVVYFLKAQEKVLTEAMIGVLRKHNIDPSDLKETITAFINQGVINTGEIQGNLSAKINSIVFRRSGRTQRRGTAPTAKTMGANR